MEQPGTNKYGERLRKNWPLKGAKRHNWSINHSQGKTANGHTSNFAGTEPDINRLERNLKMKGLLESYIEAVAYYGDPVSPKATM